jgi:Glycosyl hydrolase catalytic core
MPDQPAARPTNVWDVLKWIIICACIVIILIVVLANVIPPPAETQQPASSGTPAPAPAPASGGGATTGGAPAPAPAPASGGGATTGGAPAPAPASGGGATSGGTPAPGLAPASGGGDTSGGTPAPAPAPASGGGATGGSSKKGFVVGNEDPTGAGKVAALNAKWYYTWGYLPSTPPASVPFTPMFWNVNKQSSTVAESVTKSNQILTQLQTLNVAGQENILLAYNEPDGTNADAQANMTVGQAVQYWPQLVATGRRLGSPVMYGSTTQAPKTPNPNNTPASGFTSLVQLDISNTGTPNVVTLDPANIWLDNFLVQISNLNPKKFPDFICIHWYGPPKATSLTDYLTAVYNKYKLPIWVTEYSCADWDATCCPNQHTAGFDWSIPTTTNITTNATAQFMRDTISFMNSSSFIERYSWKERFLLGNPDGTPPGSDSYMSPTNPDYMNQSALFMSYKHFPTALPPLTPLGQLYASL